MYQATGTNPQVADWSWRKASYSNPSGNCVEVGGTAAPERGIAIRDTQDRDGHMLVCNGAEFDGFIRRVRAGRFDHLVG